MNMMKLLVSIIFLGMVGAIYGMKGVINPEYQWHLDSFDALSLTDDERAELSEVLNTMLARRCKKYFPDGSDELGLAFIEKMSPEEKKEYALEFQELRIFLAALTKKFGYLEQADAFATLLQKFDEKTGLSLLITDTMNDTKKEA